jgi:hypothetical protein
MWYEDGSLECEENFQSGILHGPSFYWYPDGIKKKEAHYQKGRRNGIQREWHPNGILKSQEMLIEDETRHGTYMTWYPNGMVEREINSWRGRLHGFHKHYDNKGKLLLKEIYVRGVRMPDEKYEKFLAGRLPARDILAIANTEVRRIFLEEYGYARVLADMPHKVIDRDGEQELVRIDWDRYEEPICLVKVKCPSTGAFYTLRVPPGRRTVKSAVAWTFDVNEAEYLPEKET